jgi:hypothetical protein
MKLLAVLTALLFSFPNISVAQQPAPPASSSSSQATTLLTQSLAAQTGKVSLTDVTLSGTARRIAGSDDDTGTAIFKALVSGAGRTDLILSSGERSEVSDLSSTTPAGAWSGPDRVSHPTAFHNLLSEPAWFFPAFAIARRLSASGYIATYVGHESRNSVAVEHVSLSQPIASSRNTAALFLHLSQADFYLDSTTLLPVSLTFNVHPDNDAGLDIPSEIRYSDYRVVNGTQVPFHIQKYLNNSLFLDFQAQTVTLNTGLSASAFGVE